MEAKPEQINSALLFNQLDQVANLIPTPLYWLDTEGRIIGFNDVICNQLGGPAVRDKILGKKHEDFYPPNVAKSLSENNRRVIELGHVIEFEENVVNLLTGKTVCYLSTRSPWRDDEGKIIGIIGTSIEITDKKEKERLALENERLKFENEMQKIVAQEQEKFKDLVNQIAHDIRSPLASMLMIVKACQTIPERERIALREAAVSINDIANNLLSTYVKKDVYHNLMTKTEEPENILISPILLQILTDKKYRYQNLSIKFNHQFSQTGSFAWVKIEPIAFKRMLSNILNNSVDALDQAKGEVTLSLDATAEQILITIKDNGKGMPQELVQSIMSRLPITAGKKNGHGLGLMQVHDTLRNNQGKLFIQSEPGVGTEITLSFPRAQAESWIADAIPLNEDDIVVILDDDNSIHLAWNIRFSAVQKEYPNLVLKHFEKAQEAINFINQLSPEARKRVFLLTDYELARQNINGLSAIKQTSIDRSILVTSYYADKFIRSSAHGLNKKILPKQLASDVQIKIVKT